MCLIKKSVIKKFQGVVHCIIHTSQQEFYFLDITVMHFIKISKDYESHSRCATELKIDYLTAGFISNV